MSGGPRPPVPGLIPLAALPRRPPRPRRRADPIDGSASRGPEPRAAAAPGRRRRRRAATSAVGKQCRSSSPALDRPPRVNPIFVWVRQEDTRIVDVKCEDYDKRNRILLTKTAHGWRAIPRTETLVAPRASAEPTRSPSPPPTINHHRHHHRRRSRKFKGHRRSTSVQFPETESPGEPAWVHPENVNIESLLPSHTIHVKRTSSSERSPDSVNSAHEQEFARTPPESSTPDKLCDVSPLENLLAVAELELKQHIQSGNWGTDPPEISEQQEVIKDANEPAMEELDELLKSKAHEMHIDIPDEKSDDCDDYNEEDEIAMNDILSRLEQSLESPVNLNHQENHCDEDVKEPDDIKPISPPSDIHESDYKSVPEYSEEFIEETPTESVDDTEACAEIDQPSEGNPEETENINNVDSSTQPLSDTTTEVVESSTNEDEPMQDDAEPNPASEHDQTLCLDLSFKNKSILTINTNTENSVEVDGPTDLSIPKCQSSPNREARPPSQSSEAIQSPQPSGIPAVPPSPDIVSTSISSIGKSRSVFLESLLATSIHKSTLNSEVMITKQKEPLDLGKCRKSASPTVTCSEEIVTASSESEPPAKKLKPNDITLKTLLDKEVQKLPDSEEIFKETILTETPTKLLGLLKTLPETFMDPVAEYKQLLLEIDIPEPLMVPKDCFADLLMHPRREILKILSGKANKNLHIEDILVVYKDKLLAALEANSSRVESPKSQPKLSNKPAEKNNNVTEKPSHGTSKRKNTEATSKTSNISSDTPAKNISATDIDAATEAAFNQMMWLPYQNHLEAMGTFSGNQEQLLQALYSTLPFMPGQLGDLHPSLQMMLNNRMAPTSPVGFPALPPMNFSNPLEFSMWQEAMLQANMLRNKNPYENSILNQPNYRGNLENKRMQQQQSHSNRHQRFHNGHNNKSLQQQHQQHQQQQEQQQQNLLQGLYGQSSLGNQPGWQNPYFGLGGYQQGSNNIGLNVPQYNNFGQKSPSMKNQQLSPTFLQKQKESTLMAQFSEQEKRYHQQFLQDQQKMHHQKLLRHQQQAQQHLLQQQHQQNLSKQQHASTKPTPSSPNSSKDTSGHSVAKKLGDNHQRSSSHQPIDLSGSQSTRTKSKPVGGVTKSSSTVTTSSKSHEDVPEVGSTTASIEEMQDAHAQLWHPLFGSNKGYSPWNLPSVTATGE